MPIPHISKITDFLYISAYPEERYRDDLVALNIHLILSMSLQPPKGAFWEPPFHLLWLPSFDSPYLPIPQANLRRGAAAALAVIKSGGSVLTHCKQGVHRGVAMACCVLIATGMTAYEAMELVREKRPIADPYAEHIEPRIRKFEREWQSGSRR